MEYPLDVIDESEQSSNTHDTIGNKSIDDDNQSVSDENVVDEEPDGPHVDLADNWSLDILEDYDPATCELEQEYIGALMSKCRSFIKLVNKSSIMMMCMNNLKQRLNIHRSLQLDCKSRWNSSHRLIETMLMYRKLINKVNSEKYDIGLNYKQTKKLSSIDLDQADWQMLETLEFVLQPFIRATKLISGSQYSTIGIGFFTIVQIWQSLEDSKATKANDSETVHRLKQLLFIRIEKYFNEDDSQWDLMKVKKQMGLPSSSTWTLVSI